MALETRFTGAIPEIYDRFMGPVLFEPYAREIASRVPAHAKRVVEIAAGTGRLTRHLLARLPADGELVATDLNPPMLERAAKVLPADPRLVLEPADAQALPFSDAAFDACAFQFGLMFVPDRVRALAEICRVLRPGGVLVACTWDHLSRNPASQLLHELAYATLPDNPPAFMATPFSLHDAGELRALALAARFSQVAVDTVELVGESPTAADLATGFVRGNPLATDLEERGIDTDAFHRRVADALAARYGAAPCRTPMSAHVLVATV